MRAACAPRRATDGWWLIVFGDFCCANNALISGCKIAKAITYSLEHNEMFSILIHNHFADGEIDPPYNGT
jgi:hypothetical protein